MQIQTIKLLDEIDSNIKVLNLNKKNITGILDLYRFTCLEELKCEKNDITEIINLSKQISKINCNYNQITSLDNLENLEKLKYLTDLDCNCNNITTLDKLPVNLETIYCECNKIEFLDKLPKKLKTLYDRKI